MRQRSSKPTIHPGRSAQSALLGQRYLRALHIRRFALRKVPPEITAYLRHEASDIIMVLTAVSVISIEWNILMLDPLYFGRMDIHHLLIQMLVAYSSILTITRCGLNISKDLVQRFK